MKKTKVCPRCRRKYSDFPALSRRDNKTDICTRCGQEEAFIDVGILTITKNEIKFLKKLKK